MAFIDIVLQRPSYGWSDEKGELIIPTRLQLFKEAFSRVNIFKDRRNWISVIGWFMILCMMPFLVIFLSAYFSWPLLIAMIVYSMVVMGTHGNVWYHRYCTHRSYTFSHPIFRFIVQHLVIKTIPEEIYVISHQVHHAKSDRPGDPYNSKAGFLYCFLADVNHQGISKTLSQKEFQQASHLVTHTGIQRNTYGEYQKRGSIVSPYYALYTWILNWAFWYTILYLIGGHALATALFAGAMLWFILVRTFNYTSHGSGKKRHIDGVDFDRSNFALNQTQPGILTGEWHNNHHLFPGSARAGFLPHQLDLAWIFIWCMHKLGIVSKYHDSKQEFLKKYYADRRDKTTKTVED